MIVAPHKSEFFAARFHTLEAFFVDYAKAIFPSPADCIHKTCLLHQIMLLAAWVR